jgi:hypothetical protein
MAEKTLPPEGLSGAQSDSTERRAFLRRAVGIGLPVVIATVKGRAVLAQVTTPSGCASLAPSGWRGNNPGHGCDDNNNLMLPGGEEVDPGVMTPAGSESLFEPTTESGLNSPGGTAGSDTSRRSHGSGS